MLARHSQNTDAMQISKAWGTPASTVAAFCMLLKYCKFGQIGVGNALTLAFIVASANALSLY